NAERVIAGDTSAADRLVEGSDQAVAVGVGDGGGPGVDAELGEDGGDVALGGPLADGEGGGDGPVGVAGGEEAEHFQLARRQAVGDRRRGAGGGWRGLAGHG